MSASSTTIHHNQEFKTNALATRSYAEVTRKGSSRSSFSHPNRYELLEGKDSDLSMIEQNAQSSGNTDPANPSKRFNWTYVAAPALIIGLAAIAMGIAYAVGAPGIPQVLLQQKVWIPLLACGSLLSIGGLTSLAILKRQPTPESGSNNTSKSNSPRSDAQSSGTSSPEHLAHPTSGVISGHTSEVEEEF